MDENVGGGGGGGTRRSYGGLNLDGGRSRNDIRGEREREGGGEREREEAYPLIERQEESAGNRPRAMWLVQSTS